MNKILQEPNFFEDLIDMDYEEEVPEECSDCVLFNGTPCSKEVCKMVTEMSLELTDDA